MHPIWSATALVVRARFSASLCNTALTMYFDPVGAAAAAAAAAVAYGHPVASAGVMSHLAAMQASQAAEEHARAAQASAAQAKASTLKQSLLDQKKRMLLQQAAVRKPAASAVTAVAPKLAAVSRASLSTRRPQAGDTHSPSALRSTPRLAGPTGMLVSHESLHACVSRRMASRCHPPRSSTSPLTGLHHR
jgi:hypothetical protein